MVGRIRKQYRDDDRMEYRDDELMDGRECKDRKESSYKENRYLLGPDLHENIGIVCLGTGMTGKSDSKQSNRNQTLVIVNLCFVL